VHFETALNLVWVLLGGSALINTIHSSFTRNPARTHDSRWLHIVGVALIVAALFPYISATDDVLRIEHFKTHHNPHHPSKQSQNDDLMRLYETMDSPLVGRITEVSVVFFFVSVIFVPVAQAIGRIAPFRAGRSPPLLAAF